MGKGSVETVIEASPDEVWALVADYGNLSWMPGIETSRREGDDRILTMGGMTIVERLVNFDEGARSLSYTITEGIPVQHHLGTVTVHPEGEGSKVVWDFEVEPDEMLPILNDAYTGGLAGLKGQFA